MKKFAVLHVTKLDVGGIGAHIDRKHTPHNADPERAQLNVEFIESSTGSLKKDIDKRIAEGYTSERKIRTDAVKAVGVILSGSPEQMKEIEKNGELDAWCKENLKFAQERFGEANILRFTLHMDEKTPHIHCVFTPLKDGRLHYKSFVDGKKGLTELQDAYASEMLKFGLKRGLKQSRTPHTTTRQFYASLEAVKPPELKKNLLGVVKDGEAERLHTEAKLLHEKLLNSTSDKNKLVVKLQEVAKENAGLKRENEALKREITEKDALLLTAAKTMREALKNPLQLVKIIAEQGREIWSRFYSESNIRSWVQEGTRNRNQNREL